MALMLLISLFSGLDLLPHVLIISKKILKPLL
jgi:hypothetical protein